MDHGPDRLVIFVAELPLDFTGRKAVPGRCQQVHRNEPVPERQLAAMHDRVSLQALPVTAVLALEALFVVFPVMLRTATLRANHTLFLSDFTPFALAALLVGEFLHKSYRVHSQFLLRHKCTKFLGAMYDNHIYYMIAYILYIM